MKKIKLTQNKYALVDDEDYEFLSRWKWCAHKGGRTYYAKSTQYSDGKKRTLYMHRLIMIPAPGQEIDHIDRNGLNNQKANLRVCTHKENSVNRIYRNKTGYRGIKKHGNRWEARISFHKKRYYLGIYHTPEEAAHVYSIAAKKYYGEFACLNKPEIYSRTDTKEEYNDL